jgi:hypothetical protein
MVKKNLIALGVVLGIGCFASAPASAAAVVCVAEAVDDWCSACGFNWRLGVEDLVLL